MPRFVEFAIAVFAFVMLTSTNAYYPLLGIPPVTTEEELLQFQDVIRNALLLPYIAVLLLVVLNGKKIILGMAAVWPIVLMVAIAWLSILWSVDPETTYRRSIALTITTLIGIYLFVRFEFADFLRFLTYTFSIIIIASFAWVFLFPEFGTHVDGSHAGVWRGIFFHKNPNGRAMVFALPVIIAAVYCGCVSRVFGTAIGILALVIIIGTTSKTSLIAVFTLIAGFVTVFIVRGAAVRSTFLTLAALSTIWFVTVGVYFSYESILVAIGRDPTLTGRTEIWAFVLDYAVQRPLTGFGYQSFWLGEKSPGAILVDTWGISDAHNGWLEIFVALGLPVVLLLLMTMIAMLFRGVVLARYYPDPTPAMLILMYTFAVGTIAMSESVFMIRHSIDWMMIVSVAGCARALTSSLGTQDPSGSAPVDPMLDQAAFYRQRGGAA